MLSSNGRFLIYASRFSSQRERLRVVGSAVARVARTLKLGIDVAQKAKLLSIYVYYKNDRGGEEIPVYCDWGKDGGEEDIYHAVKSVMFALSFHPEHNLALQAIRKELCTLM